VEVLAIADDLTGAIEAGAKFAERGMRAAVTTRSVAHEDVDVLVIDTESRHLDPHRAAEAVARSVIDAPLVYKKTDSTLRGSIRSELEALRRAFPDRSIAYVGAYPAMGRTVRGGRLYVKGVALDQTEFARDALNPVASAWVRDATGEGCEIFDGESDEDVERTADLILADDSMRIVAGPAAIAAALARRLRPSGLRPASWPRPRQVLVVNGSRHPVAAAQVEFAIERGCAARDGGAWKVFGAGVSQGFEAAEVARRTGAAVRAVDADAIVVFGGDTAFGILEAFGRPLLRPLGEILPGVPISRMDGFDRALISKAGGFGERDLLCRLREALER
jgi:uncharacterized protein YgbK (DUF1537 family)